MIKKTTTHEPVWLGRARTNLGTKEIHGPKNNPKVVGFWKSAHLSWINDDETPWCAGFANAMLEESGVPGTRSALAKSFAKHKDFIKLKTPIPGCIVVLNRPPNPSSGHVGFFTGLVSRGSARYIRILGGNQGDAVSEALFAEKKLHGYYWPRSVPQVTPKATETEDGEIALDPTMASLEDSESLPEAPQYGLLSDTNIQKAGAVTGVATPFIMYLTDWRVWAVFMAAVLAGITLYVKVWKPK